MIKREGNYVLHPDSKEGVGEFFKIKEFIDEYAMNFSVFKLSRKEALKEVLIIHSEFVFMHNQGRVRALPDIKMDFRNNEVLIQESLKWAIKLIYKFCEEKPKKNNLIKPTRKEIIEFIIYCYKLDLFYNLFNSAGKGQYHIKLLDNRISFHSSSENNGFLAYNSWRQAYRERKQINDINSVDRKAIQEVHMSDFHMPEEWDLGAYTLAEFKEVSKQIDKLCTAWFINHLRENKYVVVGKYRADGLVKINHKNWWVNQLVDLTGFSTKVIESIVDDLTYVDTNNSDPCYQFFIQLKNNELALPAGFVASFVRPERNLIAYLPKKDQKLFSRLSNDCEDQQIQYIKKKLKNSGIIVISKKTKAQDKREGMDLMLLDPKSLDLLIIELKWRIPPASAREMYGTDEAINKGIKQIKKAEEWVEKNLNSILKEYLGEDYSKTVPKRISYCVVINENIGAGSGCELLDPIITVDHLLELLEHGLGHTINCLDTREHRIPQKYIKMKPLSFNISNFKFEFSGTELLGEWLDKVLEK
ncbi:hypothetical protein ACFTRD_13610 [Paenibacillus sp. NPDC056933]|uniref:hypothetical protein n=1 Tax=Paenibacillus sp. NPDC056933 TaxID=3345968 RepID=UPI00362FE465